MDSLQKPPSALQLAWMLAAVLGFSGWLFHLDWSASNHPSRIPARDLVGAWVVNFGDRGFCTELHPDWTYATVGFGTGSDGQVHRGHWSVEGDVISWDAAPRTLSGYSTRTYNATSDSFSTALLTTEMGNKWTFYKRLTGLGARCTPAAIAAFNT